jgi:phage regulator Rha-like protein
MKNKKMDGTRALVPIERITHSILLIRGQKVLLDEDLAELYGVETKLLNRAIKRNRDRFPEDFLFQLTLAEFKNLRFQFGTSRWGGRRYPPYAFTEHGAIMAATVLNTPRAVEMSVFVVRAFVRLRQMLATHADLARKLAALEKRYDAQFKVVFDAIRELMIPPESKKKRPIGFAPWEK